MKLIWEYTCNSIYQSPYGFPSGGNVIELTDHSIFVSTAAPDSRVFIVNRDKEILWSALPQRWNKQDNKWTPISEYRASIIQNRLALERLIWHGEIIESENGSGIPYNSVGDNKLVGSGTQ